MPKPVTSHGHAQKKTSNFFLYLVRAGIAASPSRHNQGIKTTTFIFSQMQHKYHPCLPEDYECCVPGQIPSMKSLEAKSATENPSHAQKRSAKPCIFLLWKNAIPTTIILGGKLELPLNKPRVQFTECADSTNWIQMHRGRAFSAPFLKATLGS